MFGIIKGVQLFFLSVGLIGMIEPSKVVGRETNILEQLTEPLRGENHPIFENVSEAHRVPYQIEYQGEVPLPIVKEFEQESVLIKEQKNGIVSERIAAKQAMNDADLLRRVLFRYGYFDADIQPKVELQNAVFKIQFMVSLGKRYEISSKRIYIEDQPTARFPNIEKKLMMQSAEWVSFQNIMTEKKNIKLAFKEEGFYFARMKKPDLEIDEKTKTATVIYTVHLGKLIKVADIVVAQEIDVPKSFILHRIAVRKGEILKRSLVERSKLDLMETGLFGNVRIVAARNKKEHPVGKYQNAVLKVSATSVPSRVIGFGAHYTASEGVIGTVIWQNKNYLHKAHGTGIIATVGQKEMAATAFYDIPDVFLANQRGHFDSTIRKLNTKAYHGQKASASLGMIQAFRLKKYEGSVSVLPTVEYSQLERKQSYQQSLVGIKTNVKFNLVDHQIYPTSGIVLDFGAEPYFGSFARIVPGTGEQKELKTLNRNVNSMTIFTGAIKGYVPLKKDLIHVQNSTVLAMLMSAGTVMIKDFEYIPFDKRFYGGGRNSIRSYGYQMSGDLDEEGAPIGGASIFEACIEPRIRISEDFGVVFFVDCSYVSQKHFPDFSDSSKMLMGGGFGIRYYTKFGPIRLDIGFPFKRRLNEKNEKIDKLLQFYITVGHTF